MITDDLPHRRSARTGKRQTRKDKGMKISRNGEINLPGMILLVYRRSRLDLCDRSQMLPRIRFPFGKERRDKERREGAGAGGM
jgi:hypothetical protein